MKQLTVFAGPNGSDKTTITREFQDAPPFELGFCLSPDEVQQELDKYDLILFGSFGIAPTQSDWDDFLTQSSIAVKIFNDNSIFFESTG